MDRWLGDGGMPVIGRFGGAFDGYGEGWATLAWTPTGEACNTVGTVQAGVHAVILDAAMNFATLAALERGERCATLEMKVSTIRPAPAGRPLQVRGEVVRMGRQVAYTEGWVRDAKEQVVAHSTGTFLLTRPPSNRPASS
jgi:uncharacterized protein (TIGR00369 family)